MIVFIAYSFLGLAFLGWLFIEASIGRNETSSNHKRKTNNHNYKNEY